MNTKLLFGAWLTFCLSLPFTNSYCQKDLKDDGLTRMQYQNPGLKVDLAVGLWGNPLPTDFDHDGDTDLPGGLH